MRVLVTGGAGFIGSNFVRMFARGKFPALESIVILDKLTYAGNLANLETFVERRDIEFIHGDICTIELVRKQLSNVDAIINFAAESHVDRSIFDATEFVKTNITGVQTILDAVLQVNPGIRFLQISTDEVYGSINSGSWSEDSPLLPNSPYSATKAGGELLARSYYKTHSLDVLVTRCSNNYGPFHFPEKLIPLFITNLLEGRKLPVYGDGKNVRDWLHVDDHCRGIYLVLTNGVPGGIYNIGGESELSNLEITNIILSEMHLDNSHIQYVEDRKGHDFRYSVDWTKINRELGYEPQVKFEDGLRETIEWYRDNRSWWKPLK